MRANAQALLMKQLLIPTLVHTTGVCVLAPPALRRASCTVPGAGKCEIISLRVHFFFLHLLIENLFTPRSTTPAEQRVHSSRAGALLLAVPMGSL